MTKLDMPSELTIDDIHLLSTESDLYKGIGAFFMVGGDAVAVFKDCALNDMKFDAVLYRWGTKPPTKSEMKERERKFTKRVKELMQA